MKVGMATRILILATILVGVFGVVHEREAGVAARTSQDIEEGIESLSTRTYRRTPRRRTRYHYYYPTHSKQRPSNSPVAAVVASPPSPSVTPQPSRSPTPSPSASSVPRPSLSSTPSPSLSSTPSPSLSSTPSLSPSPTSSSSSSPSPSPSPASVEDEGFVIQESNVIFFRLSQIGVSVTAGTSATLSFDLTISGLEASVIAGMDAPFRTLLTRSELEEYEELVSEYEGSLDIPFLEFLNANLATDVTVSDLREGCSRVSDCRRQTRAARTILANQTPTSIRLTGQISVSGTSAIPTTAFPVFRAAEVVLSDGRQVVIVSSNPADVLSSTGDGAVLGSGADSLTVTEA